MRVMVAGSSSSKGDGGGALAALEGPFVLLDDARAVGAVPARLFHCPAAVLTAATPADIPALLDDLRAARRAGLHAAGYFAYDAGAGFAAAVRHSPCDPALHRPGAAPLAWFGLFAAMERIAPDAVAARLPDPGGAWLGAPQPLMARDDYLARVAAVQAAIAAGDIYQANLTFAASVAVRGSPLAAYARLRAQARAGYGAFVWTGVQAIASLSPELFFALSADGGVIARPMKGTAQRGADAAADAAAVAALAADPKQRAENLMIVDLIRNDLARVAMPGSVEVPDLFRVETFPTIHQMVSDVTARLVPGADGVDVLAAAFPCGSITGAPKVRAMEIIAEQETGPRGVYTGSIGYLGADGAAAFNVAIRTLIFDPAPPLDAPGRPHSAHLAMGTVHSAHLAMGRLQAAHLAMGSGIVADSVPAAEWQECLAKGGFVAAAAPTFDLIETMRHDPVDGIVLLDGHMARLSRSAAELGFAFDRHSARNLLQSAALRTPRAARVRLRLARSGALAIAVDDLPRLADRPVAVAPAVLGVARDDIRLRYKTSDRAFYDDARTAVGTFEVVLTDADGFVTEGSFTNIFVEREGLLLTPPSELGLLAGVLRADLLARGRARESSLRLADLADGFFVGNALRGLIPARLATAKDA